MMDDDPARRLEIERLEMILLRDPTVGAILQRARALDLPDWYLGAGGVAQTVWNHLHCFEPMTGIKDYDLVYFDETDLSAGSEQARARSVTEQLGDLDVTLDVKNEARVHLWYEQRFGIKIAPYRSTEHAISTWPTTASSIGVRSEAQGFVVCAPFGLNDLFSMVVRANKTLISEEIYLAKVERWLQHWPRLTIVPWAHA